MKHCKFVSRIHFSNKTVSSKPSKQYSRHIFYILQPCNDDIWCKEAPYIWLEKRHRESLGTKAEATEPPEKVARVDLSDSDMNAGNIADEKHFQMKNAISTFRSYPHCTRNTSFQDEHAMPFLSIFSDPAKSFGYMAQEDIP